MILLTTPLAKAEISGKLTLKQSDIKALATYKRSCDLCKLDLMETKLALDRCYKTSGCKTEWWQEPEFIVGGITMSFITGAILGLLVK